MTTKDVIVGAMSKFYTVKNGWCKRGVLLLCAMFDLLLLVVRCYFLLTKDSQYVDLVELLFNRF